MTAVVRVVCDTLCSFEGHGTAVWVRGVRGVVVVGEPFGSLDPGRRRWWPRSGLWLVENCIASASIVSASVEGHKVDALALEADEGRCRLR